MPSCKGTVAFLQAAEKNRVLPEPMTLSVSPVPSGRAEDEHGDIFYFLDVGGYNSTQIEWFMKLWWPHCEALYAHLLNHALFGEEEDWQAFRAVDDYAFDRFSDPEHGEWYGYLDREGRVTHRFKGAPYKSCFHVPCTLWLCGRLLAQLDDAD